MDFYHEYIAHKMITGEITEPVISNLYTEMATDQKCIRLTVCDISEEPTEISCDSDENPKDISSNSDANKKEENFLKRLFHKIFG